MWTKTTNLYRGIMRSFTRALITWKTQSDSLPKKQDEVGISRCLKVGHSEMCSPHLLFLSFFETTPLHISLLEGKS